MKTKDTEINFYAKVTPEELEEEFFGLEALNRLLNEEVDQQPTELETELSEPTEVSV